MVAVPEPTPSIIPVKESTVATAILLLNQIPFVVISETVQDELAHTVSQPDMAAGNGFTVRQRVELQPEGKV